MSLDPIRRKGKPGASAKASGPSTGMPKGVTSFKGTETYDYTPRYEQPGVMRPAVFDAAKIIKQKG